MKRYLLYFTFLFLITPASYGFTGIFVGWENFGNQAIPLNTKANSVVFGVIGNTPTRVYFYYNVLGKSIFTSGESPGTLGWGLDLAGGIGYRFLNASYKKSGWDMGMDLFAYLAPYFLNSATGYTETTLYYGVGLGLTTIYKINPYIGVGFRAGMKYNIGAKSLSSRQDNSSGIMGFVGALLTF
ncbi:MAG: hypothetical protein ACRCTQ_01310 [Brevinemataceae bacterium]